jgi:pimeloyl-ACP methyl ester carboxylesterase
VSTASSHPATLVLLHGMLCNATVWAPVQAVLPASWRVCVPDLCSQATVVKMAQDAWGLADGLGKGGPVVLAGFSMGGYVALEMLAQAHQAGAAARVQGLALVATSVAPEPLAKRPFRERLIAGLSRKFEPTLAEFVPMNLGPVGRMNPALVKQVTAMYGDVGPVTAVRQLHALMARSDHRALLASHPLPCTVLCGEDDQILPMPLALENVAAVAGAQLVRVPHCGHMMPLEQPRAVADALRRLVELV